MFTQSCFIQLSIQNNEFYLTHKLEELGYKPGIENYGSGKPVYLIVKTDGAYYYATTISLYTNDWGINCIENEKLFLALASLRNDTDYNQWMICKYLYKYPGYQDVKINDWVLCKEDKCIPLMLGHFKKATVKEIMQHFK